MTAVDWSICLGYLVLVLILGWRCSRGQHTNEDYFVGDRRMNWMAIGVSLFATTFSALSFVGLPREAAYEDYHLYLAILFIPLVSAPIVGWLFVPLYHRLQLTSAYEYLEHRFDRRLRLFGSLLACLYTLGWMGSMLYATGVILQAVLGLTETQLTWTLVGLGLFTTLYTSIGGFKAVVWTDVVQAVVLSGGMLLVLVVCDWLNGRTLGVRTSRLLCGLFGVGAIITSLLVPYLGTHVFDIIITIAGALFGPLLGVFSMGIFFPRANAAGAAIGLAAGAVSLAAVYPTDISPWWYGAFTCVPTFTVGVVSSYLFPAPAKERIEGLVVGIRRAETGFVD